MQFAGCASAARRLFTRLPVLAGLLLSLQVGAQTPEAQGWYSQGVTALDERRYSDARAAFLQAITADPTFAGAWLDMAIAAHAEGDTVQAEEFLTILEARFRLPAAIAAGVRGLRQEIDSRRNPPSPEWRWHTAFQAGAGHDNNANAGLTISDLTLTFPGGGVVLPLTAAQRPRADRYALTSLATDGWRKEGDAQIEAGASIKSRVNGSLREFDTVELQVGVGYASSAPPFSGAMTTVLPGPWRVGATVSQLRLGGNALLNSVAFSALHGWKHLSCGPQAGVEIDFRHFPVASNLDSRLLWLTAGASCPTPALGPDGRLSLQLRTGWEVARSSYLSSGGRPGDDTRHVEVTLAQKWSWAGKHGRHRLEAQLQWARARDTEGYSPLLADNARRALARTSAAMVYTIPLQDAGPDEDGWTGTLALQAFRQRSNIEVFRLDGRVVQFTVQKSW